MSKNRIQKREEVQKLVDLLRRMKSVVFSSYSGLKVTETTALRRTLRGNGVEYFVAKRTLLKRALAQAGFEHVALDQFEGSIALAFGFDDEVLPAKLLETFRKDHEAVELRGGIVTGEVYSAAQIQSLAKLPSRLELIASMLRSISAPATNFVSVLNGPVRGFVQVLRAKSQATT